MLAAVDAPLTAARLSFLRHESECGASPGSPPLKSGPLSIASIKSDNNNDSDCDGDDYGDIETLVSMVSMAMVVTMVTIVVANDGDYGDDCDDSDYGEDCDDSGHDNNNDKQCKIPHSTNIFYYNGSRHILTTI